MDRSITQAIHGLIPSFSSPLPPQLIDLASSLLAQSRSRASSLKAEEEIARSYACANLACERLRQSLSLPKIEPRPPCPPRVYQKLYCYLDSVLPVGVRKTNKPSPRHKAESTLATARYTKLPFSDKTSLNRPKYHAAAVSRRKISRLPAPQQTPVWTMPVIRRLCKRLGTPGAPHHIFAGVSSIITSIQAGEPTNVLHDIKIPALIIAIYFFTTARLAGVEIKSEKLVHQMAQALILIEECAEQGVELEVVSEMDVRAHLRRVALEKWVEMDWFRNIELGSGIEANGDGADLASNPSPSENDEQDIVLPGRRRLRANPEEPDKEYLRPGLGTMMQEKVDYLSDEHERDFQEWKMDITLRIREMEQ